MLGPRPLCQTRDSCPSGAIPLYTEEFPDAPALQPGAQGLAGHLTQLSFDEASPLVRFDYEPVDCNENHTDILASVTPDGIFHHIDPTDRFETERTLPTEAS